jgi:hypothetical protein
MRESKHNDQLTPLIAAEAAIMSSGVADSIQDPTKVKMTPKGQFGFPKQHGQSHSYWLEGAHGDELLNHRTTPDLPSSADIVIIGSGVSVAGDNCREQWLTSEFDE